VSGRRIGFVDVTMRDGHQSLWATRMLARGGHVRTGLEDNLHYEKGRLAASNAALVARLAELCGEYERHPASPEETRRLLHLAPLHAPA
jgi:uncharacterized protein (DUF849 family)